MHANLKTKDPSAAYTESQLFNGAYVQAIRPRDKNSLITTGHPLLDRATGGFVAGMVWVLGGRSSDGKSSAAIGFADDNMLRGKRVLIISGEDSAEVYSERFLARRARVSATRLREGRLTREEL